MATREAARYWWVFLVSGILWLLIAWVVLRLQPDLDRDRRGAARGGVPARRDQRGRAWPRWCPAAGRSGTTSWPSSSSSADCEGFIRPVNTFFALASVLGLILIFYGAFEIIQAIASRAVNPYWWLKLILGILLVLLAFWVSGSDRVYALAQRTYLILFGWASWPCSGASSSSCWRSRSTTQEGKPRPLTAARAGSSRYGPGPGCPNARRPSAQNRSSVRIRGAMAELSCRSTSRVMPA
jgi:hypothetical protein